MSYPSDPNRRLPVPVAGSDRPARKTPQSRQEPPVAPFTAQVIGQDGARRGLRGGKPVLDAARAAYLETEWSGPDDRRPPKGLLRKTEV